MTDLPKRDLPRGPNIIDVAGLYVVTWPDDHRPTWFPITPEAFDGYVNRCNQLTITIVEFLEHWDSWVPDRGFTLAGAVDTMRAVLREGIEE